MVNTCKLCLTLKQRQAMYYMSGFDTRQNLYSPLGNQETDLWLPKQISTCPKYFLHKNKRKMCFVILSLFHPLSLLTILFFYGKKVSCLHLYLQCYVDFVKISTCFIINLYWSFLVLSGFVKDEKCAHDVRFFKFSYSCVYTMTGVQFETEHSNQIGLLRGIYTCKLKPSGLIVHIGLKLKNCHTS